MCIRDRNSSLAMNNFGSYYGNVEKNYDEMKKYYLMAINLNNIDALFLLKKYYNNDLLFYKTLMSIENKSNIVLDELDNVKYLYEINLDINTQQNNIKECIICYETKIHLQFECGHEACYDCFKKMNKCFYNCKN